MSKYVGLVWAAALFCLPATALAQAGDATAGRTLWSGAATMCRNCHGANGEGGFGPDLAGRRLTVTQFARAVRQPWGVMPAFTAQQVSDAQVVDLVAYFNSLAKVPEPGAWRVPIAAGMPQGQQLAVSNGCAQCHGADLAVMRQALGAVAPDFPWFSRLVYSHTANMPELETMLGDSAPIRMGNFSPLRVPEPVLQEIWKFLSADLGFRARIQARVAPGAPATGGTQYTVTVTNNSVAGKGLVADDVAVNLTLPAGTTVASTTGTGYQGIKKDGAGADIATWRVPRMAPRDVQTLTITLGGSAAIQAGTVTWARPAARTGVMGDTINIALPPRPTAP